MKFLQLRVQIRGIRRFQCFAGKLLILFAGLHKLLLQVLQIDILESLCFQRCNFTLQFLNPHSQPAGQFFAALSLLLRKIKFAAQINRILFQRSNFFTPVLEKRLRRQQFEPGEPLLRLLIEQG